MTKEQAIEAMKEGNKVTHTFFLDHEWAKMEGDEIITEDGIAVPVELFWENRSRQGWSNGWSIFKYPTTASGSAENTTKERQFNLPPAAVFNLQQIALADDDMVKAPGAAEKYRFIARHILELFTASGSVAAPKEDHRDALIKAQSDYIDFLSAAIAQPVSFLHTHNWNYSKEDIEKGKELREVIERARKLLSK